MVDHERELNRTCLAFHLRSDILHDCSNLLNVQYGDTKGYGPKPKQQTTTTNRIT